MPSFPAEAGIYRVTGSVILDLIQNLGVRTGPSFPAEAGIYRVTGSVILDSIQNPQGGELNMDGYGDDVMHCFHPHL